MGVSDFWSTCSFQVTIPWKIFLTISCSLFWCFHNFSSWKVCSCELCRRFILSTFSAFILVPGKLSTKTLSQLGVNFVGTANLKNASSHRVTSKGRSENQEDLVKPWTLESLMDKNKKKPHTIEFSKVYNMLKPEVWIKTCQLVWVADCEPNRAYVLSNILLGHLKGKRLKKWLINIILLQINHSKNSMI